MIPLPHRTTHIGRPTRPRKPNADRFRGIRFSLPESPASPAARPALALATLIAAGALTGAFLSLRPQASVREKEEDITFIMEDKIPPPPEMPPPPDPAPPPPKLEAPPEPPPPPQFGLEEKDLNESGPMAMAAGNTLMKEAEPITATPPPTLPPAPVFIDQAPRILAGAPPDYPGRALDRGLEATVMALITIDTLGRVTEVAIEASGGSDFDAAVRKSASATLFQPPVRQGRKVTTRFRRPYEFKLED
ncbi:MAG: energy transducer TonB [Fibrobacteria bacterium]